MASTTVRRSPKDVFDYIAEVENNPRWHRRAIRTWRLSDGPLGPGSTWRSTALIGLGAIRQLDFHVTEYEPNRRLMSWTESVRLPFGSGYEIEPQGDHTRVDCIREMRFHGLKSLILPLLAPFLQREIDLEAQELRRELEGANATVVADKPV